jgi:hypothetical protein
MKPFTIRGVLGTERLLLNLLKSLNYGDFFRSPN